MSGDLISVVSQILRLIVNELLGKIEWVHLEQVTSTSTYLLFFGLASNMDWQNTAHCILSSYCLSCYPLILQLKWLYSLFKLLVPLKKEVLLNGVISACSHLAIVLTPSCAVLLEPRERVHMQARISNLKKEEEAI